MCGLTAQLVEHRTGIAEIMGSNPVEALSFLFSVFFFPTAYVGKFTAMIILYFHPFIYNRSTDMNYFIYMYTTYATVCYLSFKYRFTDIAKVCLSVIRHLTLVVTLTVENSP